MLVTVPAINNHQESKICIFLRKLFRDLILHAQLDAHFQEMITPPFSGVIEKESIFPQTSESSVSFIFL